MWSKPRYTWSVKRLARSGATVSEACWAKQAQPPKNMAASRMNMERFLTLYRPVRRMKGDLDRRFLGSLDLAKCPAPGARDCLAPQLGPGRRPFQPRPA